MSKKDYTYNYYDEEDSLLLNPQDDDFGFEEDQPVDYVKPRRGPKKGPRKKIVYCYEFENKVIPLYDLRAQPQKAINTIVKNALNIDSIIVKEGKAPKSNLLTGYLQEFYPKDKTLQNIFKTHKGTLFYLEADVDQDIKSTLNEELKKFYTLESEINLLKEQYVWKCWGELGERTKGIAKIIVYTKSLSHEESENLVQDSSLYFHHLHIKYNPYFIENKKVPYIYYMLNMVRQKLRYHVQAYHIKKNKEDLKEEISDFDMTSNYLNSHSQNDGYNDWKAILSRVEQSLPSDKHRLVFEMLKDGHKQKNIAKAIDYTQSWVSTIVKKKIRAAIIKELIETGQEDLLESLGVNIEDYKDEDFSNIWDS